MATKIVGESPIVFGEGEHTTVGNTYIDRGDVFRKDFIVSDFIIDDTWRDLSLAGIVPTKAFEKPVLINVMYRATEIGKAIRLRKKGYTDMFNSAMIRTVATNISAANDIWVVPDNNGLIEYRIHASTWNTLDVVIRGWWT